MLHSIILNSLFDTSYLILLVKDLMCHQLRYFVPFFSSNTSGSAPADGNGGRDDGGKKKDPEVIIDSSATDQQHISNTALAQIGVPDNFPEVPILPVLRNPIFPKFVKLIEVHVSQIS